MGQSWIIAAPRANEVLDFGGKLGEILFDGSAECLVMLLAVPVRPVVSVRDRFQGNKGVIQNPDGQSGQEKVDPNDGLSSLSSQCAKRKREDSMSEEAATAPSLKVPKPNDLSNSSSLQTKAQRPTLRSLPSEVSDLIFGHLTCIQDVLNLSLTTQALWNIGQRRIQDYFVSFMGLWAGKSIICLGQDIKMGDYPPGMLTEDDANELKESVDEDGEPMTLYRLTDNYHAIKSDISLPTTLLGRILDNKDYYKLPDYHRSQILKSVYPELTDFYPSNQSWILRNLTSHEYVRADAIALTPEYIHGPRIKGIGFGEVILSRICWSTSSSVAMEYDGNIHKGVWAGHRFEITTLAKHREDTNEIGWRDVSEEVAKDIVRIWESEYGSCWREQYTLETG